VRGIEGVGKSKFPSIPGPLKGINGASSKVENPHVKMAQTLKLGKQF